MPLQALWAHSTRAQAISITFLSDVSMLDICRAATWSSVCIFARQYAVTMASRSDAKFGKIVLQSLFKWTPSPTA